jgi:hypothetical protein
MVAMHLRKCETYRFNPERSCGTRPNLAGFRLHRAEWLALPRLLTARLFAFLARSGTLAICSAGQGFSLSYCCDEYIGRVRFRHELCARWQFVSADAISTGGDDKLDWRPPIADGPRKLDPIHRSRHFNVCNNDADIFPRLQDGNRFMSIARFNNVVASLFNRDDRLHAYDGFVFHHQHDEFAWLCHVIHIAHDFLTPAAAGWLEMTTFSLGERRLLALRIYDGKPALTGTVPYMIGETSSPKRGTCFISKMRAAECECAPHRAQR